MTSFWYPPIETPVVKALVELEKYDIVICGSGGFDSQIVNFPWYMFNLYTLADFASPGVDFPIDVQKLIEDKVYAQIASCRTLRLTDPEGTDVSWTNYDDKRPYKPTHALARPWNTGLGFGGKDDCVGVIAGTTNHMGSFPWCKAFIEGGQVVKVEGGGRYGEIWREKLERYKNVKTPPFPAYTERGNEPYPSPRGDDPIVEVGDPGLFFYWECAIGTVPWVCRLPEEGRLQYRINMLHERKRAGVIHNGMGPNLLARPQLQEAGLPWMHLHIHSLFATLEGKTEGGSSVTIIERGHLTALDDHEVRSLASKYGNPDEQLTEAWIPAMPGINVAGDYMKDYGQAPIFWMKREADEHPIWID